MRIAFTHNIQLSDREDEAEFDHPETIRAITEGLTRLGHDVEPIEVSGPASRTVARLEALAPDLVFNTAEGRTGRFREAFHPALFDRLGLPFTGSDAYTCGLTLDKQITKLFLASHGVPTPRWAFFDDARNVSLVGLTLPVIVKPNFEGSSKGITQESVVDSLEGLKERVGALLTQYPSGVLVEEYVEGRDISVCFLERGPKSTGGLLEPAERVFTESFAAERRFAIYDYAAKRARAQAVETRIPAALSGVEREQVLALSRRILRTLTLKDLARIEFRVRDDGRVELIEVDALPDLAAGGTLLRAAAASGIEVVDGVLDAIVKSAAERHGLTPAVLRSRAKKKTLRVGLTFNLKRVQSTAGGEIDSDAEYDSPKVIAAVRAAIESYGHEVVELEATPELPAIIGASGVDVVFNMAEGIRGRNREAQVPAILELLDIPYSGSDAATMSLALDKALAKRLVSQAGIPTAPFLVMLTGKEKLPKDFRFPAIVKPVAEGSSKGVLKTSVVESEAELRELVKTIAGKYKQGALVEAYLSGREFTVALLGERKPRVLPPMEIVFINPESKRPVYAFDHKLDWSAELRYDRPAQVDPLLLRELERVARESFNALGCRDVARVDIRLDGEGRPNFLEVNPLPGLSPGWSDLCLIAESAGMDYRTLIGEILAPALRRLREQKREGVARPASTSS